MFVPDKGEPVSEDMNLGQAMAILLTRTMMSDHFDGWFEQGIVLRAETYSGSQYNIELHPRGQSEVYDCDEGTFDIRPGAAVVNGEKTRAEFVGYNSSYGTFILLDSKKKYFRRSSSMMKIIQTDLIS